MSDPTSDPQKDPVVHSSLSKPLFISSALLVISMVWGLYDEAYGIRPWKGYQARFVKLYSRYLKTAALLQASGRCNGDPILYPAVRFRISIFRRLIF